MATTNPARLPPMPAMNPYRTWQLVRRPVEFVQWAAQRCGDPFLVKAAEPLGSMTYTGDPEGIRAIFCADPDLLKPFRTELFGPFLGPGSLLLLSGNAHRAERKLLMPPFHGARMRAYGEQIRDTAIRHAAALAPERAFSMQNLTHAISLEIMIRAILGITETNRVRYALEAITAKVHEFTPVVIYFWHLQRYLGNLGPWARFRKRQETVLHMLDEEIERRASSPGRGDDILSLLLDARYEDNSPMSHQSVRDELVTLLFAGHETTAVALTWAFYELHRHPAIRHRLLGELESLGNDPDPEAVARLPYLDAVCHEALRLHPVAPLVTRWLTAPFTLMGYELPPGTGVGASIILAHLNPSTYPEPLEFRPERFLERSFSAFEFLPFGGGARRCIGAAFAEYEMKLVLGALLTHYELELVNKTPERSVRRNLTMGPRTDVLMRMKKR
ncbi:MAG: cytochrome P450 [Polyangiaceae bacterium]|nr:cytochrome P450 [Polyangiaceae bacterium]